MSDLAANQPTPADTFEQVLANMELRALKVRNAEERARIYNLAGDLCFDAGLKERTLSFYGRAIDVHVAAEQLDAAVAVCRKIVRLTPEVVRARCTLAWMALGRGLIQEARDRIGDYARAASSAGQADRARQHLRLMSEVSENQEVLETLAEALLELGDAAGANRAYGAAMGHTRVASDLPSDPEQRWTAVLRLLAGREGEAVAQLVDGCEPAIPTQEPPVVAVAVDEAARAMLELLGEPIPGSAEAMVPVELVVQPDAEPIENTLAEAPEPAEEAPAQRSTIADLSPLARRRRRVRQAGL